jgi:hypothetical protein
LIGLGQMDLTNVTIAIPLHRSLKFKEIVLGNIDRLAGHCKIILSDCTEEDSLFKDLKIQYSTEKNICLIGKRNMDVGWLPHWNDLMNKVKTDYFMWLPHDDEIDLDWVSANLQNLIDNSELAGSFGLLDQILDDGTLMEIGDRFPSNTQSNRKYRANQLINSWNLGIAVRAVWNKSKVLPLLNTQEPMDEWADVIWIYGILLEHPIGQITTVSYKKRWYAGSTHSYWRGFDVVLAKHLLHREIQLRNLPLEIATELFEICDSHRYSLIRQRNKLLNLRFLRMTSPLGALMRKAKCAL